jgi:hypothetical protein
LNEDGQAHRLSLPHATLHQGSRDSLTHVIWVYGEVLEYFGV